MSQQHPTMSCDGNGACKDRNRHCYECDHAEKTKRLFFNGRKDAPWVCLNCGGNS